MISAASEIFAEALATEGFGLLLAAVFAAGLARGFTGFGTAMIYMPFAGTILSPLSALITIMVFDLFGPLPNVPRALRDGSPRDVGRLAVGALFGLPVGVYLIYRIDPDLFRWMISITSLLLLTLLISGWRFHRTLTKKMIFSTGVLGGFLGGISGLAGPPVILIYMASNKAVQTIRANILLYLLVTDILTLGVISISGIATFKPVAIGLLLTPAFLAANIIGGRLFNPQKEKMYRLFAYVLIAGAALFNLPLFGS